MSEPSMNEDTPQEISVSGSSTFEDYGPDHLETTADPIFPVVAVTTQWTVHDEIPEPLFLLRFNPGRSDELEMFFGVPFGFMPDFLTMLEGAWVAYREDYEQIMEGEE